MNIFLECRCVDIGYPDPGHDEYFLVKSEKRKSKFLQRIIGDKKTDLLCYGERKPGDEELKNDKEEYRIRELSNSRDNRLSELGI